MIDSSNGLARRQDALGTDVVMADLIESRPEWERTGWRGPAAAFAIIGGWLTNLAILATLGLAEIPAGLWAPAVLLQTFLHTGLFISAHDAMHGNVSRDWPRLNRAVGRVATRLYALFSFDRLREKHLAHHDSPASPSDPDHHPASDDGFLAWYVSFVREYIGVLQILGMAAVYNILVHGAGLDEASLLVFWVLPALASTFQLFYFGTYRPHREPAQGYDNPHRTTSNDFPPIVSLLTCYHFGYHRAHHRAPTTPWWRLPLVRRQLDQTPSSLDRTNGGSTR